MVWGIAPETATKKRFTNIQSLSNSQIQYELQQVSGMKLQKKKSQDQPSRCHAINGNLPLLLFVSTLLFHWVSERLQFRGGVLLRNIRLQCLAYRSDDCGAHGWRCCRQHWPSWWNRLQLLRGWLRSRNNFVLASINLRNR